VQVAHDMHDVIPSISMHASGQASAAASGLAATTVTMARKAMRRNCILIVVLGGE
jgi:hypothetical protein